MAGDVTNRPDVFSPGKKCHGLDLVSALRYPVIANSATSGGISMQREQLDKKSAMFHLANPRPSA
jgi:hypothetical protein